VEFQGRSITTMHCLVGALGLRHRTHNKGGRQHQKRGERGDIAGVTFVRSSAESIILVCSELVRNNWTTEYGKTKYRWQLYYTRAPIAYCTNRGQYIIAVVVWG
jgi:hypothetical protein